MKPNCGAFNLQLDRLVGSLARNEDITVQFALSVFMQHAPAIRFPLEAFPKERFGAVH